MPSSFAFGFCGDDIEADAGDADDDEMELDVVQDDDAVAEHTRKLPGLIPPQKHTLEDILSTLPSSISYNTLSVPIPAHPSDLHPPSHQQQPQQHHHHHHRRTTLPIPRRSLFDILTQLKAEADIDIGIDIDIDDPSTPPLEPSKNQNEDLLTHLETGTDLRSGIYEGGFKTWECGVDLAGYLASELEPGGLEGGLAALLDGGLGCGSESESVLESAGTAVGGLDHEDQDDEEGGGFDIVELGAGSGMPSMGLLNSILKHRRRHQRPTNHGSFNGETVEEDGAEGGARSKGRRGRGKIRFILCDYNIEVLRLVTGANVLLQVLKGPFGPYQHDDVHLSQQHEQKPKATPEHGQDEGEGESDGEIDLPPTLRASLLSTLSVANLSIEFISGDWGASNFADLVLPPPLSSASHPRTRPLLLLASETLYSPSSLRSFTSTLLSLLRRGEAGRSTALVAAKKMYFGVGGGVDDFVWEVGMEGSVREVWGGRGSREGKEGEQGEDEEEGKNGREGGGGVGRVVVKVSL